MAAALVAIALHATPPAAADGLREVGDDLGLPQDTSSFDIAVGRIDGDERPDLLFGYHSRIVAYLNRPNGLRVGFRHDGGDSHACAIGDVNVDGRADLYCTLGTDDGTRVKRNRLWVQRPRGGFRERGEAWRVTDPLGRGRRTTFFELDGDGRPDLFVGNEYARRDGRPSPNRTFVSTGGSALQARDLGATAPVGALCVQAVDPDGDGRDDLLVCGGHGPATTSGGFRDDRLHLYRNVAGRQGRRFTDVAPRLGIALPDVESALLARIDANRSLDLVAVQEHQLTIFHGRPDGTFGPVDRRPLTAGRWVAVGHVDAGRSADLFVVQDCLGGRDEPDLLLTGGPHGGQVARRLPSTSGCGDTAATIDLDQDGRDEFVVTNGQWEARGPVQVFTTGPL